MKEEGSLPMTARHLALGALFCLGALVAAGEARATGYLDAIEDMPLMEGIEETGEGGIVFDKPNGRIVRAVAEGKVGADEVRQFYAETLPQLGWTRAKELELIGDLLLFRREGERLEIQTVSELDGGTEVRFSIEPE